MGMTRIGKDGVIEETYWGASWDPKYTNGKIRRINKKTGIIETSVFGFAWDPDFGSDKSGAGESNTPQDVRDVALDYKTEIAQFEEQFASLGQGFDSALAEVCDQLENTHGRNAQAFYALKVRCDEIEEGQRQNVSEYRTCLLHTKFQQRKILAQLEELFEENEDIKDTLQDHSERLQALEAYTYAAHASTLAEARAAWEISPSGSLAVSIAYKKWNQFALPRIRAAKNLEEAEAALEDCHEGSPSYDIAMEKVQLFRLGRVATAKEAKALYNEIAPDASHKELAKEKWELLAFGQAVAAQTIAEVKEALAHIPPDGNAEKCALQKWESLALIEVEQANTLLELRAVQRIIPHNGNARKVVEKKIIEAEVEMVHLMLRQKREKEEARVLAEKEATEKRAMEEREARAKEAAAQAAEKQRSEDRRLAPLLLEKQFEEAKADHHPKKQKESEGTGFLYFVFAMLGLGVCEYGAYLLLRAFVPWAFLQTNDWLDALRMIFFLCVFGVVYVVYASVGEYIETKLRRKKDKV